MYELKDSYFAVIDTQLMVIGVVAIALVGIGFFFLRNKRRNHNQ